MVSDTPNQCDEFQGRRLKIYMKTWETITEDPEIIETVSGLKSDSIDNPPSCSTINNIGFSKIRKQLKNYWQNYWQFEKLLAKQVIIKCAHEKLLYDQNMMAHITSS